MNDSTSWLSTVPSPRLEERLAFSDWLQAGVPGSVYVYATCGTLGDKGVTKETLAVAEQAKEAYAKGLVILCQRRQKGKGGEPDEFDYMAIKKKHQNAPLVFGEPWKIQILGPGKKRK